MDAYSLYEEVRTDGTIPETVLIIPNSEWDAWKEDRKHRVRRMWIPNPRKIEQDRKDAAVDAAILQLGVELGVTNRSGALWKTPTNGPSALISEVYLKPASYQLGAEQSALYTPSEPTHNVARRYATWQGAERRPRPQNHQPAQPLSQRPTPPQSSGGRPPLSQDLQKLILDIDNVRQNTRGLPVRAGLKMGEFAGHFDPDTGMLLASSPLRPFFGDPNLFPRKTWDWNRHNIIAYPRPRVPYGSEDANEPPAEFVNRARITNQLETTSLSQMRVDYDKFQEVVDSDAMRDGEAEADRQAHGRLNEGPAQVMDGEEEASDQDVNGDDQDEAGGEDRDNPPVTPVTNSTQQPIPQDIWDMRCEIMKCKKGRSGLFNRTKIATKFPERFGQRSHGMKAGSPLRQFEGDTRLFSEDEWERLTEESNKPRGATAG